MNVPVKIINVSQQGLQVVIDDQWVLLEPGEASPVIEYASVGKTTHNLADRNQVKIVAQ